MTAWLLILHLVNFVMPAVAMAVFMPLAGRWVMGPGRHRILRHMAWHALLGAGVLSVGLVVQGHDGTMATYGTLVVVAGTLEWVLRRGWSRGQ
jgi:hypothetical protein